MNILFDVDDTLYDQIQPFKDAFEALWKEQYDVDVEELYKVSRKYSNAIFDLVMDNTMSVDDSGVYRIRKAMEEYGYTIDEEEALRFQLCYRNNQSNIQLSETMKEMLTFCRSSQYKIGILTNGMSAHQRSKINGLCLTQWVNQNNIFVSDEVRVSKPDVKVFKHIEKKMQLDPMQTWYVGDSYEHDVVGAKRAGWNMIFFNRRNHDVSKFDIQPDYIVESEKDLLELVLNLQNMQKRDRI